MRSHSGVFLGTEELEVVNEFKYLGVIIDSRLTFKKTCVTATGCALRGCCFWVAFLCRELVGGAPSINTIVNGMQLT